MMNTIDTTNSLEKDKSVNPQQTQFTSSETPAQQETAFVAQFETSAKAKIRRMVM